MKKRASVSGIADFSKAIEAEIVARNERHRLLTERCGISRDEALDWQEDERACCRADFWHWIARWGVVDNPKAKNPDERRIPLVLWPEQERYLRFLLSGIESGRDCWVNKSREVGATWLACHALHWLAWTQPDFSALAMSRVETLLDDKTPKSIFGKLRFVQQLQPDFLRARLTVDTYMRLVYEGTGGTLLGESTNSGAGRSTRHTVVLRDEWAHVDRHKQRPIALALESVARTNWVLSTPNGKGEDFHVSYTAAPDSDKIEMPWKADPRRTEEWYASLLRENGGRLTWDEREQEYNCSFAAVSGLRVFKADASKIAYTDAELSAIEPRARKLWPIYVPMDFGSGPSWTVCLFILVNFDLGKEYSDGKGGTLRLPAMWLDRELVWQRVPVLDIGNQIMAAMQEYSDTAWHFGDPAGRNVESDQESWQSNLNAAGVPITCLDGAYNTETLRDESIIECQMMLDRGLFKVNLERCPLFMSALESWEWDVPAGISIEAMNRATLKPRKDGWSHPMDAFRYAVSAGLRIGASAFRNVIGAAREDEASEQPGGKIAKMIQRQIGGRPGRRDQDGPPVDLDGMGVVW